LLISAGHKQTTSWLNAPKRQAAAAIGGGNPSCPSIGTRGITSLQTVTMAIIGKTYELILFRVQFASNINLIKNKIITLALCKPLSWSHEIVTYFCPILLLS
jgi:hypothetical protein